MEELKTTTFGEKSIITRINVYNKFREQRDPDVFRLLWNTTNHQAKGNRDTHWRDVQNETETGTGHNAQVLEIMMIMMMMMTMIFLLFYVTNELFCTLPIMCMAIILCPSNEPRYQRSLSYCIAVITNKRKSQNIKLWLKGMNMTSEFQ